MSTLLLLLVVSQSLSLGLGAIPDECADALRSLTGHLLFERAAITHVTTMDLPASRLVAEPELAPRVPTVAVAYTVQGPRNEVAIVVCAPDVDKAPAPAPAASLAPALAIRLTAGAARPSRPSPSPASGPGSRCPGGASRLG